MSTIRSGLALTFDDVLLVPRHSSVHPRQVSVQTRLTRAGFEMPDGIAYQTVSNDGSPEAGIARLLAALQPVSA